MSQSLWERKRIRQKMRNYKRWMTEWMFKVFAFCQGWWHKEYILWLYKIKVSIFFLLHFFFCNTQERSWMLNWTAYGTYSCEYLHTHLDSTLQCCMHSRWINNNNNQVSTFVDRRLRMLIRMWQCALMERLYEYVINSLPYSDKQSNGNGDEI